MPRHAIHLENPAVVEGRLTIEGEEARHALRVKRLGTGDEVEVLDGRGGRITGRIVEGGRELVLEVLNQEVVAPVRPRVEVWAATPKGPRLDRMIDALCQVGAAAWVPTHFQRSVVDPRATKLERVERLVAEASKQCRRAWRMEIGARASAPEAWAGCGAGVAVVIADGSGTAPEASGCEVIRVVVGPEGGMTSEELRRARDAGARICAFGSHTMRTEVAAPVAAAIMLHLETKG